MARDFLTGLEPRIDAELLVAALGSAVGAAAPDVDTAALDDGINTGSSKTAIFFCCLGAMELIFKVAVCDAQQEGAGSKAKEPEHFAPGHART